MSADFAVAFEALRQRFLRRAADDLDVLVAYQAGGDIEMKTLQFTVHRMAGAAATFGCPEVSAAASNLEADWRSRGEIDRSGLEILIAELRALPAPTEAR